MQDKYTPEYAKGEILVLFKNNNTSSEFASEFGKRIGYTLSTETYDHGDYYIYKTAIGKEKEAITHFKNNKYSKFVESACLRDNKRETRWSTLEELISMITELNDNIELPDTIYSQKIKEIINYLKKFK